jgi:tetratricopeptide (TPR) repeat protein
VKQLTQEDDGHLAQILLAMSWHNLEETAQAEKVLSRVAAHLQASPGERISPMGTELQQYAFQLILLREVESLIRGSDKMSTSYVAQATAWARYHTGDLEACWDHLERSLAVTGDQPETWVLAARVQHELGRDQEARDWLFLMQDWLSVQDPKLASVQIVAATCDELTSALNISGETMSRELALDRANSYSRLATLCPNASWIYHLRGSNCGRLRQWEEACLHHARSAELNPSNYEMWRAWAVSTIYLGRTDAFAAVCRLGSGRFSQRPSFWDRSNFTAVCNLTPLHGLDRQTLLGIADEAALNVKNDSLDLACGAAAYRCGQYRQALKVLPEEAGNRTPMSLAYRAMAYQRLGNSSDAHQHLARAHTEMQSRLPSPEGPELPWQCRGRSVIWCMNEIVLKEAEALIEPSTERAAGSAPVSLDAVN